MMAGMLERFLAVYRKAKKVFARVDEVCADCGKPIGSTQYCEKCDEYLAVNQATSF